MKERKKKTTHKKIYMYIIAVMPEHHKTDHCRISPEIFRIVSRTMGELGDDGFLLWLGVSVTDKV